MKRRNTRPGRRLDARRAGGAGPLPLPTTPDVGRPRFRDGESGLSAPTYDTTGHAPVMFARNSTIDHSKRHYRSGRPHSSYSEPELREMAASMSTWESYGMRLMVN